MPKTICSSVFGILIVCLAVSQSHRLFESLAGYLADAYCWWQRTVIRHTPIYQSSCINYISSSSGTSRQHDHYTTVITTNIIIPSPSSCFDHPCRCCGCHVDIHLFNWGRSVWERRRRWITRLDKTRSRAQSYPRGDYPMSPPKGMSESMISPSSQGGICTRSLSHTAESGGRLRGASFWKPSSGLRFQHHWAGACLDIKLALKHCLSVFFAGDICLGIQPWNQKDVG